jgi:DNA topoisomerase-1
VRFHLAVSTTIASETNPVDGTIMEVLRERARDELVNDLHKLLPEGAAVLALLQQRLQDPPPAPPRRKRASRAAARAL